MSQYVFPWLRELERTLKDMGNGDHGLEATGSRLEDAYFQLPREKTATLQSALGMIDQLFKYVGTRSANADIMGDVFEYLLSEIETSGKNGQFRTPRHIIRFMIELLDPQPGQRIIDPAAGTGGFLINSIQHILKQYTDPQTLVLEWDGTPHRLTGGDPQIEEYLTGHHFTGYDNDRTMVRIGWMNMILHGIEAPLMTLRDSLDKNEKYDIDTGAYDLVMANPPFTGAVDDSDLHEKRFPRNPRNTKKPITNKSELLFIWVMLDLLGVGRRAAVVVPEGVLFGSTGAHRELRRQLLLEHRLEGVISLPAGVFLPYAGVKTSILVFQKMGGELKPGEGPRTEQVWFYDVAADGYTLDAKRNDKPEPNDLWDAARKWKAKEVDSLYYYQPEIFEVRWRVVDDEVAKLFPNLAHEKGNALGIHEMFHELPTSPEEATTKTVEEQRTVIRRLYWLFLHKADPNLMTADRGSKATQDRIQKALQPLNRLFNDAMKQMLESGYEDFGRKAIAPLIESARAEIATSNEIKDPDVVLSLGISHVFEDESHWEDSVREIVRSFAKLDGYNVKLRSNEVFRREGELSETKSWLVPVRVIARNDEWTSEDGAIKGTHDERGEVRREFLLDPTIYENGAIKAEYLEPGCIEANDFNLSAARYKPFTASIARHDPPADIIRELQAMESSIQEGLKNLLAMVEGAE